MSASVLLVATLKTSLRNLASDLRRDLPVPSWRTVVCNLRRVPEETGGNFGLAIVH
jgi:hypothetical protein